MQAITSKVPATYSYGFKIKHLLCFIFVFAVIFLHLFLQQNNLFTSHTLKEILNNTGHLSPVLFIISYACGVCLFFPAMLFTAIGAMLFGATFGFFYNMAGAMLGASMAFFLSRCLGRHLFLSKLPDQLSIYENKLSQSGFAATLYLRLICFPFTPLSFGMGLTQVTFAQYFWGTFFGKIASGLIITFFFATLQEVVVGWQFEQLLQWKTLLACLLFIGSFYIPKLVCILKLNTYLEQKRRT